MFQPHGFGPLAKMKNEFIAVFAKHLNAEDMLVMPEPVYFGGTVEAQRHQRRHRRRHPRCRPHRPGAPRPQRLRR